MIKILYFLISSYFFMLIILFIFQRNLTYFPTPLSQQQLLASGPFEKIEITSHDGLPVKSWIANGDPRKETFVFFHGNAGNAMDRMPMLRGLIDKGHTVVLAEYRGYGDNAGRPTEKDNILDGTALIDHLLSNGLEEKDIILIGRSLGSGIASQLAAKYDISALVLISSFSSMLDLARDKYPLFPIKFLMKDHYDSIGIIDQIGAPILFFHGENDTIIPISFGRALFEAAGKEKAFFPIKQQGHNDLDMDTINSVILNKTIKNID